MVRNTHTQTLPHKTCTCISTYTHGYTYLLTYVHAHIHTYTHACIQTCACVHIHHDLPQTHAHNDTRTRSHAIVIARTHTPSHALTYKHTQTHATHSVRGLSCRQPRRRPVTRRLTMSTRTSCWLSNRACLPLEAWALGSTGWSCCSPMRRPFETSLHSLKCERSEGPSAVPSDLYPTLTQLGWAPAEARLCKRRSKRQHLGGLYQRTKFAHQQQLSNSSARPLCAAPVA